eukprot:5169782-Pleurochrysis_carterae.AAC.1
MEPRLVNQVKVGWSRVLLQLQHGKTARARVEDLRTHVHAHTCGRRRVDARTHARTHERRPKLASARLGAHSLLQPLHSPPGQLRSEYHGLHKCRA